MIQVFLLYVFSFFFGSFIVFFGFCWLFGFCWPLASVGFLASVGVWLLFVYEKSPSKLSHSRSWQGGPES